MFSRERALRIAPSESGAVSHVIDGSKLLEQVNLRLAKDLIQRCAFIALPQHEGDLPA
jgi:hypothetical protein